MAQRTGCLKKQLKNHKIVHMKKKQKTTKRQRTKKERQKDPGKNEQKEN